MKKILLPTDFSDASLDALRFAVDLAGHANAEIQVLHMVDLPVLQETTFGIQPHPFDPELMDELESKATAAFHRMKSKLQTNVAINFLPIHDYMVPGVREFIDKNKIDLVIMSTHGASGLGEFFIGSRTEKIARFSPVPVINIPQRIEFEKIKNIVFPNELDFDQRELMSKLQEMQQLCGAQLHVLLVNTPTKFYTDVQARQSLERFAKHYRLENYTLNVRSHQFERSGILTFMEEIKGDMLAMATHGRTGLAHFLRGSIAEAVLNRIDHPIWTCKLAK